MSIDSKSLIRGSLSSTLVFVGLSWGVAPVLAGSPIEVDVTGQALDFTFEGFYSGSGSTFYPSILAIGDDCLTAEVQANEISNVGILQDDGDGAETFGVFLVADVVEDVGDDEVASSQVEVGFTMTFGYDDNCDAYNGPSVPPGGVDEVSLLGVCLYVKDIDDRQFVSFDGSPDYSIQEGGPLTAEEDGGTVTISETEGIDSDDEQREHWAEFGYSSVSSINFSVGILENGGSTAVFFVNFECAPDGSESPYRVDIDQDYYQRLADAASGTLPLTT